jgi:hypothetical protein
MKQSTTILLTVLFAVALSCSAQSQAPRTKKTVHEPITKQNLEALERAARKKLVIRKLVETKKGTVKEVARYIVGVFGVSPRFVRGVNLQRQVTLTKGDRTLAQCAALIGLTKTRRGFAPIPKGSFRGEMAGYSFLATPKAWKDDSKEHKAGTIYNFKLGTFGRVDKHRSEQVDWHVEKMSADRDIDFVTCKIHSPNTYLVPGRGLSPETILVTGKQWWAYKVDITLKDFVDGDVIRVGKYKLKLAWPEIILELPHDIPFRFNSAMLFFTGELKRGVIEKEALLEDLDDAIGLVRRRGKGKADWCGCKPAYEKGPARRIYMMKQGEKVKAKSVLGQAGHPLSDLRSIKIHFLMPVSYELRVTMRPTISR